MSEVKIDVAGKSALVTGSNRGIGKALVVELLERGAAKVYAGARKPEALSALVEKYGDRLVPVQLDVTSDQDVAAAAELASDVQILINNAGVLSNGGFLSDSAIENFDQDLAVNVHGLVKVTRAFSSAIKAQSEGAIVNVSSLAGLGNMPVIGTYSASKAAVHSITQGLRAELANENVLVAGVYPGPVDTDMTKGFPMDKDSPENVAKSIIDGLSEGKEDIFPDAMSSQVGPGYAQDPKGVERQFAEFV